jgi:hypothetical protein
LAYSLKIGKSPQRTRAFFRAEEGLPSESVTALAIDAKGKAYIGTAAGLCYYDGKKLATVMADTAVSMLHADDDGGVWAGAEKELFLFKAGKAVFSQELDAKAVAIDTDYAGTTWLATTESVYRLIDGAFVRHKEIDFGGATAMAAVGEGFVFTAVKNYMQALHGKRPHWSGFNPESSAMPTWKVNALAADSYNHIWVGTDKGLCVYDSKNDWQTYNTVKAFPDVEVTKLLLGKNGALYVGTKIGLYLFDGVKKSFLGAERWIPGDEVTALAASADGAEFWVGTPKGASRITLQMMSLGEKAAYYEKNIEKYNVREGYVMHRELAEKGAAESGQVHVSDNDGLWTATFLAAQSLRYGATKSEEALALARRSKDALLKLMDVTGVKGFVARSYRRPSEHGFGNGDPEWHLVEDETGPLEWKCETSSDETSGHFFGLSLFFDLCADETEKKEVSDALCTMIDYIIANDYTLCDVDGKPTTWAHWSPKELNADDKWFWERGTNSLEMLSYLKTCYHMSGDENYQKEYEKLVREHHYAMNCLQYKIEDNHVNHIDDHLTMIVMPQLLAYEKDPDLRRMYLLGLSHHWQNQRIERCPYWNVLYAAMTGDMGDIENAVRSLEELPLDLTTWAVTNSKRPDIEWSEGQEFFGGGPQLVAPLPFDEKPYGNYDGNTFRPDGGNGMRYYDASNMYLVPYWAARYYGLIEEV